MTVTLPQRGSTLEWPVDAQQSNLRQDAHQSDLRQRPESLNTLATNH